MSKGFERIGQHIIYFDTMYFLTYAGGKRELTKSKQKDWDRTLGLPLGAKINEQNKLGFINNPNVIPIKGIDLVMFIKELNHIPFFDFRPESTLIQLTDMIVYESLKQKSYDIAIGR